MLMGIGMSILAFALVSMFGIHRIYCIDFQKVS